MAGAGAVRTELGISRDRVARWAGVSEQLVVLYEANPSAVGAERRAHIAAVYTVLETALVSVTRLRRSRPGP